VQNFDGVGSVAGIDETPGCESLVEKKNVFMNSILTCGGTNQLESSGKGRLNHLARINTPFCFAQVE